MAARQLLSEDDLDHGPSIPIVSKNVADIGEVEDTPVFQERVAYLEVRTPPRGGSATGVHAMAWDDCRLFRISLTLSVVGAQSQSKQIKEKVKALIAYASAYSHAGNGSPIYPAPFAREI